MVGVFWYLPSVMLTVLELVIMVKNTGPGYAGWVLWVCTQLFTAVSLSLTCCVPCQGGGRKCLWRGPWSLPSPGAESSQWFPHSGLCVPVSLTYCAHSAPPPSPMPFFTSHLRWRPFWSVVGCTPSPATVSCLMDAKNRWYRVSGMESPNPMSLVHVPSYQT